jgi:hypothetical protein
MSFLHVSQASGQVGSYITSASSSSLTPGPCTYITTATLLASLHLRSCRPRTHRRRPRTSRGNQTRAHYARTLMLVVCVALAPESALPYAPKAPGTPLTCLCSCGGRDVGCCSVLYPVSGVRHSTQNAGALTSPPTASVSRPSVPTYPLGQESRTEGHL